MNGVLIALLVIPLTIGTYSWVPTNMGCAREAWFVKSEFNIFAPVLFRAVLRTSLRKSCIFTVIASIVMVHSTMERLRYCQTVQLPIDPQKSVQDKEAADNYLRASLASFIAILWIEGCTLYRLIEFCDLALRNGVQLLRIDRWSIALLFLAFNSFFVLVKISERVVAIFSSLNNDTSIYVYWLLAAASTVTRVFAQGVIQSSSTMRTNRDNIISGTKKNLSSVLWLDNVVMLVQFALLAKGYLYDLQPQFMKSPLMMLQGWIVAPTLLGCMVVVDLLFRVGTILWLVHNRWIAAALQGNEPVAIQGNGPAAIQGNEPAAIQGNELAAIQGNEPVAIQGNGPVAIQGNEPAAIQGNGPPSIQGNEPAAIQGNGPVAIQGNATAIQGNGPATIQGNEPEEEVGGREQTAGSMYLPSIEAVTSGMPSAIVISVGQTCGYKRLRPKEFKFNYEPPPHTEAITPGETSALCDEFIEKLPLIEPITFSAIVPPIEAITFSAIVPPIEATTFSAIVPPIEAITSGEPSALVF